MMYQVLIRLSLKSFRNTEGIKGGFPEEEACG